MQNFCAFELFLWYLDISSGKQIYILRRSFRKQILGLGLMTSAHQLWLLRVNQNRIPPRKTVFELLTSYFSTFQSQHKKFSSGNWNSISSVKVLYTSPRPEIHLIPSHHIISIYSTTVLQSLPYFFVFEQGVPKRRKGGHTLTPFRRSFQKKALVKFFSQERSARKSWALL